MGRGAELDAVAHVLACAVNGDGGALLVTGDAEVGKTRLVQQACADADAGTDLLVLSGACLALSSMTIPLLPLRDAVRRLPAEERPMLTVGSGRTVAAAEVFDDWLTAR